MALLVAFASGSLFALGLAISGMTQPGKVIGFLNVLGPWDASLAFVMAGAIAVYAPVARWMSRRDDALLGSPVRLPSSTSIDGRLVAGSALFGLGWGLAGYCPGPALTSAATGASSALVFVPAMLLGMALHGMLQRARARRRLSMQASRG